jgi:transcriptional regulator with XRE-family HTH domain
MSTITYQDMLTRLKQECLKSHLSQEEISRQMRMSQSHYSKAESGNRRFSFYEIQCLRETQIDLHYVFTGKKAKNEYSQFFRNYSYMELVGCLNLVAGIVLLDTIVKGDTETRKINIYPQIKFVKYAVQSCYEKTNILYNIRMNQNCTQQKMAEMLQIDIKTLCILENDRKVPDSELLWKLYNLFHIPPAILLEDKNSLACEVSCLLDLIDEEKRDDAFGIIQECCIHRIEGRR